MLITITHNGKETTINVPDGSEIDVTDISNVRVTTKPQVYKTVVSCPRNRMTFRSRHNPNVQYEVSYLDGKYWCQCEHFVHHKDLPDRDHCWHIETYKRSKTCSQGDMMGVVGQPCPKCGTPLVE